MNFDEPGDPLHSGGHGGYLTGSISPGAIMEYLRVEEILILPPSLNPMRWLMRAAPAYLITLIL